MMIMWLDSSSSIDRITRFDGDLIDLEQILLLIARSTPPPLEVLSFL